MTTIHSTVEPRKHVHVKAIGDEDVTLDIGRPGRPATSVAVIRIPVDELRAALDKVAPAPVYECPNPSAHEDREDDVTLLRHDLALMERRAEKAEENVKAREEMINRLAVRAEKAEMERDKARAERDEATAELMAEQSRGFTAEDVTTDRAITHRAMAVLHRIGYMASEATTADTLRAALTEPPARPEWEQEGAKALTLAVWGMEIPNEAGEAGDKLAASLARHGYQVVRVEGSGR